MKSIGMKMVSQAQNTRGSWLSPEGRSLIGLDVMEKSIEEIKLRARQDRAQYYVYLDTTGQGQHHCTCVDWLPTAAGRLGRSSVGMFCRHIAAAAFKMGLEGLLLPFLARCPGRGRGL